jgi:hypothetical protein
LPEEFFDECKEADASIADITSFLETHPMTPHRLLFAVLAVVSAVSPLALAGDDCGCTVPAPIIQYVPIVIEAPKPSWVFMRSRYTHDPDTGARVAQYAMKPPVEPLDDPRLVTSGYTRSRVVMRGPDGTNETSYRVTNYGNGRGGMDAEWERFHDAWRGSTVAGGNFSAYGGFGAGYGGYGYGGYPGYGGGYPGYPGYGPGVINRYPPGYNYQNGPLAQGGAYGFGPGYGTPDAGRLDPDAADGYREQMPRTPDKEFFNRHVPGGQSAP